MNQRILQRCGLMAGLLGLPPAAAWGQTVPAWTPVSKWSNSSFICPSQREREDLARRAAAGEAKAQDRLGTFHLSTCQDDKNVSEGIKLLERAAGQGSSHAQLTLGEAYRDGKAGARDLQKAVAWFEKAAVADDARGPKKLVVALRPGPGGAQNGG